MIPSPDDLNTHGAGWVGGAIAAIIASAIGLRRWLSGDAAAREGDRTEIEFLRTLMTQLDQANERADRFARERNEAVEQIGELKAQVASLQAQIAHMQVQIDKMVCLT